MITVREVEPSVLPESVGRVPNPRPPESGEATIWQVYGWTRAPMARRYLYEIACDPTVSLHLAMFKAGSKANTHSRLTQVKTWRVDYPGFRELEIKLRNEPITAAHFIAIVTLPKSLAHMGRVLENKGKGADSAARYIIQVANLQSRNEAKKGAPEQPGGRGLRILESLFDDEDKQE